VDREDTIAGIADDPKSEGLTHANCRLTFLLSGERYFSRLCHADCVRSAKEL